MTSITATIQLSSPGYFLQDLQHWLNLQQPHVSLHYNQLIDEFNAANGDTDLESNDVYWPTVWSLALHARQSELLNLLACHPHANSAAFRTVRDTVAQMPLFDVGTCSSSSGTIEFEFAWRQWQRLATDRLSASGLLSPYCTLELLAGILLGNEDVFCDRRVVELTEGCWFYAVVAFLRYSRPLADAQIVNAAYKSFRRSFQRAAGPAGDTTATLCDARILAAIDSAFSLDLGAFVTQLSRGSNDWWLCAHLVDLIGKINPQLFPGPLAPLPRSDIFGRGSTIYRCHWLPLRLSLQTTRPSNPSSSACESIS